MAHRIIINSIVSTPNESVSHPDHSSSAEYSFAFEPSHHLTEQEEMKRVAKIRRVLAKLATDVTASSAEATE